MLMRFTCYLHDDDFKNMSETTKKKFNDSGRNPSLLEYGTMINTDHIVSLEEKKLYDGVMQSTRAPIVVATMTTGKTFFIKAKSISELRLRTMIDGNGEL